MELRNYGRNLCRIPFATRITHAIIMIIIIVRIARRVSVRFGEVPVTVRRPGSGDSRLSAYSPIPVFSDLFTTNFRSYFLRSYTGRSITNPRFRDPSQMLVGTEQFSIGLGPFTVTDRPARDRVRCRFQKTDKLHRAIDACEILQLVRYCGKSTRF